MPGAGLDGVELVAGNLDPVGPAALLAVVAIHADGRVHLPRLAAEGDDATLEVHLQPWREGVQRAEARQELAERARDELEVDQDVIRGRDLDGLPAQRPAPDLSVGAWRWRPSPAPARPAPGAWSSRAAGRCHGRTPGRRPRDRRASGHPCTRPSSRVRRPRDGPRRGSTLAETGREATNSLSHRKRLAHRVRRARTVAARPEMR